MAFPASIRSNVLLLLLIAIGHSQVLADSEEPGSDDQNQSTAPTPDGSTSSEDARGDRRPTQRTVSTANAHHAVREASMDRIDAILGIDSEQLAAELVAAADQSGVVPATGPAATTGAAAPPSVIKKLLDSGLVGILINLLPIGNKLDLVKAIVAVVGKVVGGSESAEVGEAVVTNKITEDDEKYLIAHVDDIRKALEEAKQLYTDEGGQESGIEVADDSRLARLIELEQARRSHEEARQNEEERLEQINRLQRQTR